MVHIIVCILFLAAGIYTFFRTAMEYAKAQATTNWDTVDGVVVAVEIEEKGSSWELQY